MNKVEILFDHWWELSHGSATTKTFGAARIVAILTLVTQLASVAKELTVAVWFGSADALDAFLIAFLLPTFVITTWWPALSTLPSNPRLFM